MSSPSPPFLCPRLLADRTLPNGRRAVVTPLLFNRARLSLYHEFDGMYVGDW